MVSQRLVGEKHLKLALRLKGTARGSEVRDAIWFGRSRAGGLERLRIAYRLEHRQLQRQRAAADGGRGRGLRLTTTDDRTSWRGSHRIPP